MVMTLLIINCQGTLTVDAFLARELVPYPNDYRVIDERYPAVGIGQKGFLAYQQGQFKDASAYLMTARVMEGDKTISFFAGQAHLADRAYEKAFDLLNELNATEAYYYQALWYKILILVKLEKTGRSKTFVRQLCIAQSII